MALQSSGVITLGNVNTELGLTSNNTIGLADANVRSLFGISSGAISLSDGYGKAAPYPAQTLTYDGTNRAGSTAVTLEGGQSFTVSVAGSTAIDGRRLQSLHVICFGAGGAGSTWPNSAAGGYGGAGYRISLNRSSGGSIPALLDSITGLAGQAGNSGTPWWNGYFGDNRQAGGAGGTSYLNFNGTRLITAKGGNGSRAIYNNNDSNFVYSVNSSYVGDNGGTGAGEGGSGGSATYGGGGGASTQGSRGTSTYAGNGGYPGAYGGQVPGGGGGGIDSNSNRVGAGGYGRVIVYINTSPAF